MNRRDSVSLEIPGYPDRCVEPDFLPAVGTRIQVHKHLTDGGTTLLLEVVRHDWHLQDDTIDVNGEPQNPTFEIRIRTRVVQA